MFHSVNPLLSSRLSSPRICVVISRKKILLKKKTYRTKKKSLSNTARRDDWCGSA